MDEQDHPHAKKNWLLVGRNPNNHQPI
jgi:hypothetical protein